MSKLKYTYALDSTRNFLVHIDDAIEGEIYYCPYSKCGERLFIRDGKVRRKHFSHIKNAEKCSYDNYLHTLAERKIAEWFNSVETLNLKLNIDVYCGNYDKCIWVNNNREELNSCKKKRLYPFNLKKYYDSIEIEKREGEFKWDLWLTNSQNIYSPMAIEIYVTHKCEDNKLNSKVRIIEIKINSEEQLEALVGSNKLIEGDNISCFNFEPKPQYDKCNGNLKLNKFILYENRRAYFKIVDCNTFFKRESKSLYELTFKYYLNSQTGEKVFNAFYLACAKANTKFPDFKHCSLCKFYKYNESHSQHICILYKILKLEDKHVGTNAITCPRYNLNREFIKESIDCLSKLSLDEWTKENK